MEKRPLLRHITSVRNIALPKSLMEELGLAPGDQVAMWVDHQVLVMRPIHLEVKADAVFVADHPAAR